MGEKVKLFGDFPPVNTRQWEEKIEQDLKGVPYDKLIWKPLEGFNVRPYYRSEDLQNLEYLQAMSGEFPYVRGTEQDRNDWLIREDVFVEEPVKANKKALHALNRGADALAFLIPDELELTKEAFDVLLKDIYIECININFVSHVHSSGIARMLSRMVQERNIDPERITGSIDADPLGYLTIHGELPETLEDELETLSRLVQDTSVMFPGLRLIGINGHHFHNAGASKTQELALSLALVSEYLDKLTEKKVPVDDIAKSFQLNIASGHSYFMEMAGFRATRMLYAKLIESWKPENPDVTKAFVHATTSAWSQSIYDPYVNILRGTTQSMSAALGGADSLSVLPFDHALRKSTQFSERIARNTQIILKEEAYLNKVTDPSSGSYYIENLTDAIAGEAWKIFLEIESKGGYTAALKSGQIHHMIEETARQRDMNIATRREVIVGTNQYPNSEETIHEDFNPEIAFKSIIESGKEIKPIRKYRGAQAFEELRLKTERSGRIPKVFLLTYGDVNIRKARAGFASGFFACAGFDIIDNLGFETVDMGITAAIQTKADVTVLCSSDEEYEGMAKEASAKAGDKTLLMVAGYPKNSINEIKEAGIKHFIHIKSNLLEELIKFQELLGILG